MVKIAKLRGTIVEKSTTQEAIADLIGIDRSTFYRKMKNDGNFTLKEAKDIKEALNLTNEEAIDIFFAE
ncbi:helix-turn-helix domain-containing protein [Globicatella sanguinis]